MVCDMCGRKMKHRDYVKRIMKCGGGKAEWIDVERFSCDTCSIVRRNLPDYLLPYKHYRSDIIRGVIDGQISIFDLEYEDYPCEMTMKRWMHEKRYFKS